MIGLGFLDGLVAGLAFLQVPIGITLGLAACIVQRSVVGRSSANALSCMCQDVTLI